MKKIRLLLLLVTLVNLGFSQEIKPLAFVPAEIENPKCLGINKEPYHATLMPYANLQEALVAKRHSSSLCRSLNGQWKFNWVY